MNRKMQLAAKVAGAAAGLGGVAGLAYCARALWLTVGYLRWRDEAHCAEIGELQVHVATLAQAIDGATAAELPYATRDYARAILADD